MKKKNILLISCIVSILILCLICILCYYINKHRTNIFKGLDGVTEELSKNNCDISIDKDNKTSVIEKYRGQAKNLVIGQYFEGKEVTKIRADAFEECDNLENIYVSEEIISSDINGFQIDLDCDYEGYVKLKNISKVILNENNCKTSTNKDNKVSITKYNGNASTLVIEKNIGTKEIENINTHAFAECTNLDKILINKEITSEKILIEDFKANEQPNNEDYIEYITTKEYTEAYKKYLKLSDDEKEKQEYIPNKYNIPVNVSYRNMQKLYTSNANNDANKELPNSFDLRDKINIKVKNQGSYGICYACAGATCIETNLALINKKNVEISPIHIAVFNGGYGGTSAVIDATNFFYKNTIGAINNNKWSIERCKKYPYEKEVERAKIGQLIDKYLSDKKESSITYKEKEQMYTYLKKVTNSNTKYVVTETAHLASNITYNEKGQSVDFDNFNIKVDLEPVREMMKTHIMTYGGLYGGMLAQDVCKYGGSANSDTDISNGHAICIIGWDDNFPKENFPKDCRPKSNGAFLVLNSWGMDWADNGCYWQPYEYMPFTDLAGIISVDIIEGQEDSTLENDENFWNRVEKIDKRKKIP